MLRLAANLAGTAVVAVLLAAGAPAPNAAAGPDKPLTVVELFTSEGCSSCPPADAFLRELADEPDVLALSLHVDYWDYIGWPDPFADARHTERQRTYARQFNKRYVYTPQMVIQGTVEMAGSQRSLVRSAIREARALPRLAVAMAPGDDEHTVTISVAESDLADKADVWLLTYDGRQERQVTRGENAGRTLVHRNVVRTLTRVGTWTGEAIRLTANLPADYDENGGCAVIVQSPDGGRILGAATLSMASM